MPGGAGSPSALPSQVPVRTPGGTVEARDDRGGRAGRCAATWICVGNVVGDDEQLEADLARDRARDPAVADVHGRVRRPRVDARCAGRGSRRGRRGGARRGRCRSRRGASPPASVVPSHSSVTGTSSRTGRSVAIRFTSLPVGVDDRRGHVVVARDLQADPRGVDAAVAVGRELARERGDARDLRGALEPLGDEEGRERRDDEEDERRAREEAQRRPGTLTGLLAWPGRPRRGR